MKHSRIGHWEWDFKTGATTWSAGLFNLLGFEPHSVKPTLDLFVSLIHPEDRLPSTDGRYSDLISEQHLEHEFRIQRADGEIRWLSSQAEIFQDPSGQPSWAAGVTVDVTEKYIALSQLREREEKYRALVQATSVGEWSSAPDGTITEASYWCAYTGQSAEEVEGYRWLDAVHPDDLATVRTVWEETLRTGAVAELSFRIRRREGDYHWVHAAGVPLKNEGGSIRGWVGKISDVHDQRESERSLRISEARYRAALKAGHVSIWEWDPQTDLLTRRNRSIGYGLETLPFKDVLQQVHAHDRARFAAAWTAAAEGREPIDHEFRLTESSSQVIWIKIRGAFTPDPLDGTMRLIGVAFDVTKRKKAEAEARLVQEQLDHAVRYQEAVRHLTPGFFWSANALGQLTCSNNCNWRQITGQSAAEASGWGWLNAVHPEDQERTRQAWRRSIESVTELDIEHRIRHDDMSYGFYRTRAVPVRDRSGLVREWMGLSAEVEPLPIYNHESGNTKIPDRARDGLTGAQVRAARGILNLSVRELAEMSGVSVSSVKRIEDSNGKPQIGEAILARLRSALDRAGVECNPEGWVRQRSRTGERPVLEPK